MLLEEKLSPPLSDEEVLVLSIKTPSQFKIIMERYEAAFLRKAKSILGPREEVADVVTEAFTKIYLNASRFQKQDGASFKSWAYRILINTTLSTYTRLKRRGARELMSEEFAWEQVPDGRANLAEEMGWRDAVARVLGKMPQALARALRLFFLEDLSQEEVAATEGISLSAAKTRIHRAKRVFKKIYEPDCSSARI